MIEGYQLVIILTRHNFTGPARYPSPKFSYLLFVHSYFYGFRILGIGLVEDKSEKGYDDILTRIFDGCTAQPLAFMTDLEQSLRNCTLPPPF